MFRNKRNCSLLQTADRQYAIEHTEKRHSSEIVSQKINADVVVEIYNKGTSFIHKSIL